MCLERQKHSLKLVLFQIHQNFCWERFLVLSWLWCATPNGVRLGTIMIFNCNTEHVAVEIWLFMSDWVILFPFFQCGVLFQLKLHLTFLKPWGTKQMAEISMQRVTCSTGEIFTFSHLQQKNDTRFSYYVTSLVLWCSPLTHCLTPGSGLF